MAGQHLDNEAAEKALTQKKDRLAAVVLEPMMGRTGQIPPRNGYLSFLRDLTTANGVLLIFDVKYTASASITVAQQIQNMARLGGFEPTTLGSEDRCSIH